MRNSTLLFNFSAVYLLTWRRWLRFESYHIMGEQLWKCMPVGPRGSCIVSHLHVLLLFCLVVFLFVFFVKILFVSPFHSLSLCLCEFALSFGVFYPAVFALGMHNNENARHVSKHNHWEPKELWKMCTGCTAVVSLYNED